MHVKLLEVATYDSRHRVYKSRVTDSSASTQLTTTTLYYGDGSVKSVETGDGIALFAYDYDSSRSGFCGTSITETSLVGTVTRKDFYPSGDLYQIYATDPSGVTSDFKLLETHVYGMSSNGNGNVFTKTERIYWGELGASSPRWAITVTRNDGDPIRVTTSGPVDNNGSSSQLVTAYSYASTMGRLLSITKTGEPTTWFFYDDAGLGKQIITVSGSDNPGSGGSFNASSALNDTVQEVRTYFGQYGSNSDWWEITDSYVYDTASEDRKLVGQHLSRLSGFSLTQNAATSGTKHGNISGVFFGVR